MKITHRKCPFLKKDIYIDIPVNPFQEPETKTHPLFYTRGILMKPILFIVTTGITESDTIQHLRKDSYAHDPSDQKSVDRSTKHVSGLHHLYTGTVR